MVDNYKKFFEDIEESQITEIPYKNIEKKIYESYFQNTQQLKNHFKDSDLIEIIMENSQKIGRKFKKQKGEDAYDELFIDDITKTFTQISENITLLYPPNERKNIIGYRFYNQNPSDFIESEYFTLGLKYGNKFEIIEKHSTINDDKGNSFINKKLNCLQIMITLIKNKFKNKIDFPFPNTIIEILGLTYSMMEEPSDIIKVLEPYFPSPINKDSLKENFDKSKIEKKFYLETILFNKHVSILLFTYDKQNKRKNILIDMSHQHLRFFKNNNKIIQKDMKENLFIFPTFSIQYGATCSIWYIGFMLKMIEQKQLIKDGKKLLTNIINKINELINLKPVINLNEKINPNIKGIKEIIKDDEKYFNEEKDFINVSKDNEFLISHKIYLCPYLNIRKLRYELEIMDIRFDEILYSFHDEIEEFRNKIINIKLNQKYFEIINEKFDITKKIISLLEREFIEITKTSEELIKKHFNKDDNNITLKINTFLELNQNLKIIIKEKIDIIKEDNLPYLFSNEELAEMYRKNNDVFLEILTY